MVPTITADLRLAFPIRWGERAVTRAAGESDADWNARKEQLVSVPLIWAYHTPVSREVFEANYRAIAAANMTLFSKGIGFAAESGPIIATLALRDAARSDAVENGIDIAGDPATPVLAEIRRLTMILAPSAQGYDSVPVDVALARGVIDSEDWKEAESSIVFFTCGSWMARRERREAKNSALASVLRGSMTSSAPTEFVAGLQDSTAEKTLAAAPAESSVPS